ncbi:MAG: Ig domain-containing protein [Planctomycetes bacterium]|nr:Ig domain-containing protein [Planctomycetota bacterium]
MTTGQEFGTPAQARAAAAASPGDAWVGRNDWAVYRRAGAAPLVIHAPIPPTILPPPPVITSPATATAVWGEAFTYQATADVAATFGATGLPPGLSINPATGEVSGTPVGAGTDPVVFTVTATNPGGTGSMDITVSMSDPVVPPSCVNGDVAYAGMSLTYHRRSLCSASLGSSIDGVLAHVSGSTFTGMATFQDLQPNGDPWGEPYSAELTVILLCSMEEGVPCYDIVEAGTNQTATIRHNIATPTGPWANEPDVCTVEWSGLEEHHSGSYTGGSHAVEATLNIHSWTCSSWVSSPYIEWTNEWSATVA